MPIEPKWHHGGKDEYRCHLNIEYSLNLRELASFMIWSWGEFTPFWVDEKRTDRIMLDEYEYGSQSHDRRKIAEVPIDLPTTKKQVKKTIRNHLWTYGKRGGLIDSMPQAAYLAMARRIAKLWPRYEEDLDDFYDEEDWEALPEEA